MTFCQSLQVRDYYRSCIDLLLTGIPAQHRVKARERVVRTVVTLHGEFGVSSLDSLNPLSRGRGD